MTYKLIEKRLGEEWLKKELKSLEDGSWVTREGVDKKAVGKHPIYFLFEKIDELIGKFEEIENFDKWVIEAKTSKNFKTCLFELMALDNLYDKADEIILKPDYGEEVPEAIVKKDGQEFLVEMTLLESVPKSIEAKKEKLFSKARRKFRRMPGIHFIGVFDFFDFVGDKPKPTKSFQEIVNSTKSRFSFRENKNIIAFALSNFYILTNLEDKSSLQKSYYLLPKPEEKGGFSNKFFKSIFSVDEFIYY